MAQTKDVTLDALLEFVHQSRGFDFTGYKRSSIQRRVAKRMGEVGVERYEDYLDYLELHPEEFASLFNTILINLTGFFRDPPMWEYLATEVLPELIKQRRPDAPIRAWCAGVASGEEAYTLAMALVRVLGEGPSRNARRSMRRISTSRHSTPPATAPTARARSRTCRERRSSAFSSAPISATSSARTSGVA